MTEFKYVRGDCYALTCPLKKDGTLIDLSGVGWSGFATISSGDTIVARTEAADPLKCTISVTCGNGFVTVTITNSTLLLAGNYELEVRAINGTTVYTWPRWSLLVVEPRGI